MQVKVKLNLKRNIVGKEDKKHSSYYYQTDRNKDSMNHTWENAVIETHNNKPNSQLIMKKKIIKWILLIIILSILVCMFLMPKSQTITKKEQNFQIVNCSYHDTIPTYNSFHDVPASIGARIIVDGILYEINDDKTLWTPAYLDEYIMWIGGNGDTIWE